MRPSALTVPAFDLDRILRERTPAHVRRNLELARLYPEIVAARQYLQDGPFIDPPVASPLAADATTTAISMWDGAVFTPLLANDAKAGKVYCIEANGLITTAATGAFTIGVGLGTSSPGTTLGASIAQTVPATSLSGPWFMRSTWTVRTIGAAGANSTIIGTGIFHSGGVAATANSGLDLTFGGTSCLFDPRVNNFFTFQKTLSVAGSFTTLSCYIYALN